MKRKLINPVDWGLKFSMDQGEVIEGTARNLRCSGQIFVEPSEESELGVSVISPGDLRGQKTQALANIHAVLDEAGMSRQNIVSLRFFATGIDGFLENFDMYAEWIAAAGTRPPQSLLGVNQLVLEDILLEIEAEAAA